MIRALLTTGGSLVAATALADVTLLTQERVITVETTADNSIVSAAAVAFEPFVETVANETTFPAAGGGTGTNAAVSSINCIVDPNAIRASGSLTAVGGFTIAGGPPETGEAEAEIDVTFDIDVPTPYTLTATPRPSELPRDEYEVELRYVTDGTMLVRIDETMPAQAVEVSGILAPGRYHVHYAVEVTGAAAQAVGEYGFNMTIGTQPCGPADIGGTGGVAGADGAVDNNDFVVFIDRFFAQHSTVDIGSTGGVPGADGAFDNNDFVVFIDRFFAGCG